MKILLLCHKIPYPLHDGGAYSLYHTAIGLISNEADVKVLALATPKNPVDVNTIPSDFRESTRIEFSLADTRFKPVKALMNLFSTQSYFVERFFSEGFNADLAGILKNEKFDIIQMEHVYMCLYLETIRRYSDAKVVLRPQNVENQVWQRVLDHETNPFKKWYLRISTARLLKFEMEMAAKVDGIIAISKGDAATFNKYAPGKPIVTVPVGFNFNKMNSYDWKKQFDHFPVFYHLGSMDWLPNVQGVKWFIEEVIPYVRKDFPGFTLRIAGKNMPDWFYKQQSDNLIVDSDVVDSLLYQEDKAVMIVPLLSGGGIRVKIIEGMALGKTIISTTLGAEGIPYTDLENILIANTKEEISMQIKRCRDSIDFCHKIGKNARILAEKHYDCKATGQSMIRFYKTVDIKKNPIFDRLI